MSHIPYVGEEDDSELYEPEFEFEDEYDEEYEYDDFEDDIPF